MARRAGGVVDKLRLRRPTAGTEPNVVMLDAAPYSLDETSLRKWARRLTPGQALCTSRAYGYPLALLAWHTRPVGVDIERRGACPSSALPSVCCPEERAAYEDGTQFDVTDLWSGKEAAAKAMGNARLYDPRMVLSPVLWPTGRAGRWRARRLTVPDSHVAWICWQA